MLNFLLAFAWAHASYAWRSCRLQIVTLNFTYPKFDYIRAHFTFFRFSSSVFQWHLQMHKKYTSLRGKSTKFLLSSFYLQSSTLVCTICTYIFMSIYGLLQLRDFSGGKQLVKFCKQPTTKPATFWNLFYFCDIFGNLFPQHSLRPFELTVRQAQIALMFGNASNKFGQPVGT